MPQNAPGTARAPLFLLTLVVLLAHALVLQVAPQSLSLDAGLDSDSLKHRPFITRTIKVAAGVTAAPAEVAEKHLNKSLGPAEYEKSAINSVAPEVAQTTQTAPASSVPAPPSASTAVSALSIPGSTVIRYELTGASKGWRYNGDVSLTWLHDGKTYDAKMAVTTNGITVRGMTSSGRITTDGLAPTRFAEKAKSELAAHFNAEQGKITFSANTPDAPWVRGTQDRLSLFLQLGALLAGDPAKYPVGTIITLNTVGPREAGAWVFTVEREEVFKLSMGPLPTIKLVRTMRHEYDQKLEIWFAPGLGYLPARIKLTELNGSYTDQQLRSLEAP